MEEQEENYILISIPTYNEIDNVERLIHQIRLYCAEADILFIDDNSPDGTGRLLEAISLQDAKIKVKHRPRKSGLGTAHKFGFCYARLGNYKKLITMDADLLHDPCYIPIMLEHSDKADIVIGSRYKMGASYDGVPWLRKKLTYLWQWIIARCIGLECDATGSYRVYRVDILDPEIYEKIEAKGYEFNMEALYYFKCAGAFITEIPIRARGREHGISKLTGKDMWLVLKKVLYLTWDRLNIKA